MLHSAFPNAVAREPPLHLRSYLLVPNARLIAINQDRASGFASGAVTNGFLHEADSAVL